jgi:hypothetical protein
MSTEEEKVAQTEQSESTTAPKSSKMDKSLMTKIVLAVVLVILLWVVYTNWDKLKDMLKLNEEMSCRCGKTGCNCSEKMKHEKKAAMPKPQPEQEYLTHPEDDVAESVEVLNELGFNDGSWSDVLAATELDASVHENQREFTADVRRFSSGANFTSIADDNRDTYSMSWLGLRRPQAVHIGEDARQVPDVNTDIFKRNRDLRW